MNSKESNVHWAAFWVMIFLSWSIVPTIANTYLKARAFEFSPASAKTYLEERGLIEAETPATNTVQVEKPK